MDLPEDQLVSKWIWTEFVVWDSEKCTCLADSDELCDYCKKVIE